MIIIRLNYFQSKLYFSRFILQISYRNEEKFNNLLK